MNEPHQRLSAEHQKARILATATVLAAEGKLYQMTAKTIANRLYMAKGNVFHHFVSILRLRNEVISNAIVTENASIIVQAIGSQDPAIENCPQSVKDKALESMKK